MMFNKRMAQTVGVFLMLIFSVILNAGEKAIDQNLYDVANIELVNVLKSIPDNMLVNYGFSNREEANLAQLKTAYREYFLPEGTSTSRVRILVTCKDQCRALLGMVKKDGVWSISDFGATHLARELGRLEMTRADVGTQGDIMRDLECKYDYVRYDKERKANTLIPLESVRRAYKNSTGKELGEMIHMSRAQSIRSHFLSKYSSEKEAEQ